MSGSPSMPNIAAVILAAGGSSRMEGVKQNMPWKNTTLLGHVIGQLKESDVIKIYVVLGAEMEQVTTANDLSSVALIQNKSWNQGMGVSIAKAIAFFEKKSLDYDGFLMVSCDQPMIKIEHYNKLVNSCIDHDRIVASFYNDDVGIPAVFGRNYKDQLRHLHRDVGAKSIIKSNLKHLIKLDAPEGKYDLDTLSDYQKFYNTHGQP